MATRRRVDVFFILYLTAIVAFVVVSKERDRIDQEMQELNEQIVRTLIPPVPLRAERDTLRCYVDADSSGMVIGSPLPFRTRVYVEDIAPEDDVTLTVHSVVFEDTLTAPDLVSIGSRSGVGAISDDIVAFPVTAVFPRTGTYQINLRASARRVHEIADGVFVYRGRSFDSTLISRDILRDVEERIGVVTVLVEDTSLAQPRSLEGLELTATRGGIASAVGFEERNLLRVNLGWADPSVRIIRGGGRLGVVSRSDREISYLWSGVVSSIPDTVEVEARTHRDAGGKDIARVTFPVSGVVPFLPAPRLDVVYSGEEIRFDVRVSGLDDQAAYEWKLFEEAGGARLLKAEGRGSLVVYRIPNSFAGKTLEIDAQYDGRVYRVYSRRSHAVGDSRFRLRVVEPPTRIGIDLPDRAPVSANFRFTASRYQEERFRGEQPIDRLADVDVDVRSERGDVFETDVWMVRKGEFEFGLVDRQASRVRGQRVMITIRAGDGTLRRSVFLY